FNQTHSKELLNLVNHFGLNAREVKRRNGYIVYLKEAEKITEFMSIIGAHNALFKFEDVRIVRDMRNSVNRLVNCETASKNKKTNGFRCFTRSLKRTCRDKIEIP